MWLTGASISASDATDRAAERQAFSRAPRWRSCVDISIMLLDPERAGDAIADHMLRRTRPFYER